MRIAPQRKTTPAALLREWEDEALRGRTEGALVHAYADALLSGRDDWAAPTNVRVAQLYKQATRAIVSLLKRFDFVGSEVIVFSPRLGIAGTVDLIMRSRTNGATVVLFDWKQNKKISADNEWNRKALPPIDHLDDCDLVKYSLQLGLYHKIISEEGYFGERRGGADYRAAIIHLQQDRYVTINLKGNSMAAELQAMLDHV